MTPQQQKSILELVKIALSQVGAKEIGGNNKGTGVRFYQTATWLKPESWPWCAAFTCWVLREWLETTDAPFVFDTPIKDQEKWRCKDASAFGWESWAKKQNLSVLGPEELAKAGDFVVFDFSHIGIVAEDQKSGEKTIRTVEGNTGVGAARDGNGNDGVFAKERHTSLVRSYVRLFE